MGLTQRYPKLNSSTVTGNDADATATFNEPVTVGNLIVVALSVYLAAGVSGDLVVSDNKGNTYQKDIQTKINSNIDVLGLYSAVATTAGSSFTVTGGLGTPGLQHVDMAVYEVSLNPASNWVDGTNSTANDGSNTTVATGNCVPAGSGTHIYFSACKYCKTSPVVTITPDDNTNWSQRNEDEYRQSFPTLNVCTREASGTQSQSWTFSDATLSQAAVIAAYKQNYTVYEKYDYWYPVSTQACRGNLWIAQTFTIGTVGANQTHTLYNTTLYMARTGSPGTVTVGIRAVDGTGKPTGSDLASGTTDGDTLPLHTDADARYSSYRDITMTSSITLNPDTKYAMVIRAPSGDGSNYVNLINKDGYSGGGAVASNDSGATWGTVETWDLLFYEHGTPISGIYTSKHWFMKPAP